MKNQKHQSSEYSPDWIWNVCWLYITELQCFVLPCWHPLCFHVENKNKKSLTGSDLLKTGHQQITLWRKPFIFLLLTGYKFFFIKGAYVFFSTGWNKYYRLRDSLNITHILSLCMAFVSLDFDIILIECSL